jgi:hypothetical protein
MIDNLLVLALAIAVTHAAGGTISCTPPAPPTKPSSKQADAMKIRLRIGDKILTAALIETKTTRDFISLLPLTRSLDLPQTPRCLIT